MKINIKNLRKEDIEKAAKVFYSAFNLVGEKWSLDIAEKRLEQYFNTSSCWVAEINNEIVGVLTSKLDYVLDHQELYIDIIAVDPKYHKSGIGKRLLQTAEDYARKQRYKAIWLSANVKIPSFNWYMKVGFLETSWRELTKPIN